MDQFLLYQLYLVIDLNQLTRLTCFKASMLVCTSDEDTSVVIVIGLNAASVSVTCFVASTFGARTVVQFQRMNFTINCLLNGTNET